MGGGGGYRGRFFGNLIVYKNLKLMDPHKGGPYILDITLRYAKKLYLAGEIPNTHLIKHHSVGAPLVGVHKNRSILAIRLKRNRKKKLPL